MPGILQPMFGAVVILAIAVAFSKNRRAINWTTVTWGLSLQIVFALIVLKTAIGQRVFEAVLPDDAPAADLLRLPRRRPPLGEEQVGIDAEAVGLVLPAAIFIVERVQHVHQGPSPLSRRTDVITTL